MYEFLSSIIIQDLTAFCIIFIEKNLFNLEYNFTIIHIITKN